MTTRGYHGLSIRAQIPMPFRPRNMPHLVRVSSHVCPLPSVPVHRQEAMDEALTRILTPKRSIDILRDVQVRVLLGY